MMTGDDEGVDGRHGATTDDQRQQRRRLRRRHGDKPYFHKISRIFIIFRACAFLIFFGTWSWVLKFQDPNLKTVPNFKSLEKILRIAK